MTRPRKMGREDEITAIGALADPIRRRLYEYIAAQSDPVSREAAASAAHISLPKAKFHLERLVDEGLLEAEFRRLSGKTGPGAGRPAKLYRRTRPEFQVSLPERHYDLAGDILATAIERSADGTPLPEAVESAARDAGTASGTQHRRDFENGDATDPGTTDDPVKTERLAATLATMGYEPETDDGIVRLRNCPFDSLVKDHTDLICSANRSFVQGVVEGLHCAGAEAVLAPSEGYCCVYTKFEADAGADTEAETRPN